jgi:hypothetical protein
VYLPVQEDDDMLLKFSYLCDISRYKGCDIARSDDMKCNRFVYLSSIVFIKPKGVWKTCETGNALSPLFIIAICVPKCAHCDKGRALLAPSKNSYKLL